MKTKKYTQSPMTITLTALSLSDQRPTAGLKNTGFHTFLVFFQSQKNYKRDDVKSEQIKEFISYYPSISIASIRNTWRIHELFERDVIHQIF